MDSEVVSGGPAKGENALPTVEKTAAKSARSGKNNDRVRVATVQSNRVSACGVLHTNPFMEDFSMDDLLASIELRIAWYEELFEQAAREKCKLAVLTEDFTRLGSCASYLDDRSIFHRAVEMQTALIPERFGALAKKRSIYLVLCYYALEEGAIYNVADLLGPRGDRVGRYRKVHLPQYELWQVKAGDSFPAFETDLGWIGMLICYDQMWPEAAGCCAMNGAQLICQPSAASLTDYHMRTRATDNQVHHLSSTYMNSMIVSSRAEIMADAGERDPAIVWADLDIRGASMGDEYFYEYLYSGIQDHKERHLKFRRPDAYGVLTEGHPPLADQYPEGGVANTPEAIDRVYSEEKREMRGEETPYHWNW